MKVSILFLQQILFTNVMLFLIFTLISQGFNLFSRWRFKAKYGSSRPLLEWTPSRKEWRTYLKAKARSYVTSFILLLVVFLLLMSLFGGKKGGGFWYNLLALLAMAPAVVLYLLTIINRPNRFAFYREGVTSFGWLYFATSRRDAEVSEARVGFQPWTKFKGYRWDGDVLLLKTKFAATEIVAGSKKGQVRDLLRDIFKEVSKTKKQAKGQESDKG